MKSGQILILVLLIVVVSLAVGLSVASRNLTNLRISTQTQESQRAFSAAEGGVEDVLSRLQTLAQTQQAALTSGSGYNDTFYVGDLSATVKVFGRNVYETTVPLGEVAQVTLVVNPGPPVSYHTGNLTIEWQVTPDAPIELTFVCDSISLSNNCTVNSVAGVDHGDYAQNRFAYQAPGSLGGQQGFQNCTQIASICSVTINVPSAAKPIILRIKPFHNAVNLKVYGTPSLPTQIYEINSVAKTSLGITRRVQVTRTALPALPAVFDYVLYSEGDIVK